MANMEGQLFVQRPRTCVGMDGSRSTTYEIVLETEHMSFSLPRSRVRRRYSEFVWLRAKLSGFYPERTLPSLPPRTFFTSRFDPDIVEERKHGLENFLISLLKDPVYLSEGTLHLFLQTSLSLHEIEACVQGKTDQTVPEIVLNNPTSCGFTGCSDTASACSTSDSFSQSDDSMSSVIPRQYPNDASLSLPRTLPPTSSSQHCCLKFPSSSRDDPDLECDLEIPRSSLICSTCSESPVATTHSHMHVNPESKDSRRTVTD